MTLTRLVLASTCLAFVTGCDRGTNPEVAALKARLAALEQRLDAAPVATASVAAAASSEAPAVVVTPRELALAATAFVSARDGDDQRWSGTGWLVERRGDVGFFVTNDHVAFGAAQLRIVLDSGTGRERTADATVVARDARRDLALLRVELAGLPAPLLLAEAPPADTAGVCVVGFPFGQALDRRGHNPSPTILQGKVSSLRRDEDGTLAQVQLDADMNPGHSGSAVVDERGRVIGVVSSGIGWTNVSFAVPTQFVADLKGGGVNDVVFTPVAGDPTTLSVTATVVDPLGALAAAWLEVGAERVPLQLDGATARATIKRPGEPARYVVGVKDVAGGERRSRPASLVPDEDWLGAPDAPTEEATPVAEDAPPPPPPAPAPVFTGASLLRERQEHPAGEVMTLDLDASALTGLMWSADAEHVFLLERGGLLRKVTVPALVEERRLEVGVECGDLVTTAAGLVVVVLGRGELWVVDEQRLEVRGRVAIPGEAERARQREQRWGPPVGRPRVVAAPGSTSVLVYDGSQALYQVDLARGDAVPVGVEAARDHEQHAQGRPLTSFSWVALTPDGAYVLAVGENDGALHRLRVEDNVLILEESGPSIAQGPTRLDVSADSRYVTCRFRPHWDVAGHPKVNAQGTHVYRVADLARPALSLFDDHHVSSVVGLDLEARRVYGGQGGVTVLSPEGALLERLELEQVNVDQFLVHPAGRKLFAVADERLLWVELAR
jgi:S1-C subfamily serine protease